MRVIALAEAVYRLKKLKFGGAAKFAPSGFVNTEDIL